LTNNTVSDILRIDGGLYLETQKNNENKAFLTMKEEAT